MTDGAGVLKDKKTILVFLSLYLPGYKGGGPTRTIFNMIEHLGHDFNFKIITSDRDLGDNKPYESVKINEWNNMGLYEVFYFSKKDSFFKMIGLINSTKYDVIYMNSLFSIDFTLKPILMSRLGFFQKKPIILAPRGELASSALAIKKRKKKFFLMIANLINLYGDIAWHASSEMEKNDILKNLTQHVKIDNLFKKIHIATNLSLFSDNVFYNEKMRSDSDSCFFKICFLSRIVPIKNLDFALKILASINKEIHFCIYGPIESVEYWNSCLEIIKKMPEHIHVTYGGAVKNEDVRETISHYDLFFVPTKGENFGHVFAESLSVGVPILLSDQTPWRDLQQSGVGWDISLNQPDAFKRAILDCHANLFKDEKFYTQPCISFYKEKCENNLVVEENRNLFLKLLNEDF